MSKIVVFGSSGYAGGHITSELLDRGYTVIGVSRHADGPESRANLTMRPGSVSDARFVEEVVQGADVIVVSVPATPPGGPELRDLVAPLVAAAAKAGARLGFVGGTGSLHSVEGGPRVLETPEWPSDYLGEAQAHSRALDALRASGDAVDWFYVSPPMGFGSWNPGVRTGAYRLGDDILLRDKEGNSSISGADYAIAFADEIEKPSFHRTRFTVGY